MARLILEPFRYYCANHDSTECECSPAWRLTCLASNLAVGAALCEADRRGYERCAAYPVSAECWFKPGHALERQP